MDSSDSENDVNFYWNNWIPSTHQSGSDETAWNKDKRSAFFGKNLKVTSLASAYLDSSRFGNWIPPTNFSFTPKRSMKVLQGGVIKKHEVENNKLETRVCVSQKERSFIDDGFALKKLNSDWGERVELNDMSAFKDGDLVWGVVNLGIFGHIKLWVNEYGYVCGSAEGNISKVGSHDDAFISITNTQLLRKMLNVSSALWSSLCDIVEEKNSILKFVAFEDCHLEEKTSLERLWFFLCKRRHFLQDQCMLVKLNGAVKCLRQFKISPKLIVQDIRNIRGEPLS